MRVNSGRRSRLFNFWSALIKVAPPGTATRRLSSTLIRILRPSGASYCQEGNCSCNLPFQYSISLRSRAHWLNTSWLLPAVSLLTTREFTDWHTRLWARRSLGVSGINLLASIILQPCHTYSKQKYESTKDLARFGPRFVLPLVIPAPCCPGVDVRPSTHHLHCHADIRPRVFYGF